MENAFKTPLTLYTSNGHARAMVRSCDANITVDLDRGDHWLNVWDDGRVALYCKTSGGRWGLRGFVEFPDDEARNNYLADYERE